MSAGTEQAGITGNCSRSIQTLWHHEEHLYLIPGAVLCCVLDKPSAGLPALNPSPLNNPLPFCPSASARVCSTKQQQQIAGMLREGAYGAYYQAQKANQLRKAGRKPLEFTHVMIDEAGQVCLAF